MTITIEQLNQKEFKIKIAKAIETDHLIVISEEIYKDFTDEKLSKEQLIDFSIKFLLKRECNSLILKTFAIEEISNYFPEYINSLKDFISKI
ncbi:MAG: hypothetical protein CMN01_02445 [Rickettsiales bacterium]|nr:hypothetical protein [Rickettsiales bacterium]